MVGITPSSGPSSVPVPTPTYDEPLRLVHHHPGRIRARAQVFLHKRPGDPAVVAAQAAVHAVTKSGCFAHNPRTGSILIEYPRGSIDPDELLERIAAEVGLRGVLLDISDHVHRAELVSLVLDTVRGLNEVAQELTEGRADLRELIPAGLAVLSLVSFVRNPDHRHLPRWDSALWWSYRVFLQWHGREIQAKSQGAVQSVSCEPFEPGPS